MRRVLPSVASVALTSTLIAASAQLRPIQSDVNPVESKSSFVYKTAAEGNLSVDLYFPDAWRATDHRPAIIFFFGGGFASGTTRQFAGTAKYFASRGLVAATPDYRVRDRQQTGPEKSIEDMRSAIRWIRMNAARLGIDAERVIAGGGSSGGTGVVLAAYGSAYQPEGDDQMISDRPNALLLYNPALGFGKVTPPEVPPEQVKALEPVISNWKVTRGGPPAIVFFGTEDSLIERGRAFTEQMIAIGNRAELYTADGQGHGFFQELRGIGHWHEAVVHQSDRFLASLGYLQGEPAIERPVAEVLKRVLP
jgi:acetyl esterase